MEASSLEESSTASFGLSETNGKQSRSEDEVLAGPQPTPPPVERAPTRRRCQIVATATTELAADEHEGSREANDRRSVKFVPRPSVPTLSRVEIMMRQAEDVSVRGNPCISSRKPQNQLLVRVHVVFPFIFLHI